MTIAHPFAWGLLLLAIPVIAFFFLRIRFRKELISTSIFWQQVFEERRTRRLRRRFRHFLSLLIALLFLTVLTAAVLDPTFSAVNNSRCVVIIDNSASMNALIPDSKTTQSKTPRLDIAKRQAKNRLDKLASRQQIALLTANSVPKITSGFTNHLGTLRQALAEIPITDSPADWKAMLHLAEQLIAEQQDSPIYIYTDADLPEGMVPQHLNVHLIRVGEPIDNVAITRFQPRRLPEHAADYEIFIEAVNFGAETVETRLEIELEGAIIDVLPLTLEPNKPVTKTVRSISSGGGLLRATLANTDLFPVDNTAVAFLSEQFVQRVFLYGTENFFLHQVLQAQPQTEVTSLEKLPDVLPPESVLICHQSVPPVLPLGNVLVIDPQNNCNLFQVGGRLEKPIAAMVDAESPLVRFTQFSGLVFTGAKQITAQNNNVHVLAATADEFPLYMQFASEQQKTLVLSADLNQGDFTLRTTFPLLVSQALAYFRNSEELLKSFSTAESVNLPLQTDNTRVLLRSPSGREHVFPCQNGQVSLGKLSECGVWTILEPVSNRELARIACNLFSAAESNLRSAADVSETPEVLTASAFFVRPIWYYLALLALLLTTAEWFLYQRRWIE